MHGTRPPTAQRLHNHALTRVIVLEEFQVMFLPMPKSGCTSMLWMLADIAGLDRERFAGSRIPEVSRAMAIHDTALWDSQYRWKTHSQAKQQQILSDPSWLRFSIARNPASRLWSAWQSKILLKEPRFVERFADEPWFPATVRSLDEAVDAFRAFVHSLDVAVEEAPHDAHWGLQTQLIAGFELGFVGRSEQMAQTVMRLGDHLGDRATVHSEVPRENATPIPYHRYVYDDTTAEIVNRLFAADFAHFDYAPLSDTGLRDVDEWRMLASQRMLFVSQLAERHIRIGELLAVLRESEKKQTAQFQHLRWRVQELSLAVSQANRRVREIEESRSWRLTGPLRALRRPR